MTKGPLAMGLGPDNGVGLWIFLKEVDQAKNFLIFNFFDETKGKQEVERGEEEMAPLGLLSSSFKCANRDSSTSIFEDDNCTFSDVSEDDASKR